MLICRVFLLLSSEQIKLYDFACLDNGVTVLRGLRRSTVVLRIDTEQIKVYLLFFFVSTI